MCKARITASPDFCDYTRMNLSDRWLVLAVVILFAGACAHLDSDPSIDPGEVDFVTEVKPILMNQCLPCHHSGTGLGGFKLETEERALRPGKHGPFIEPGSPEQSRLWQLVSASHPARSDEDLMPAHGPRLSSEEKRILYLWIEQGATWPDGERGRLRPLQNPNQT